MPTYENDDDKSTKTSISDVLNIETPDDSVGIETNKDEPSLPKKAEVSPSDINRKEGMSIKKISLIAIGAIVITIAGAGAYVKLQPQPMPEVIVEPEMRPATTETLPAPVSAPVSAMDDGMGLTPTESKVVTTDTMVPNATTPNVEAKPETPVPSVVTNKVAKPLDGAVQIKPITAAIDTSVEDRLVKSEKNIELLIQSVTKLNDKLEVLSQKRITTHVDSVKNQKPIRRKAVSSKKASKPNENTPTIVSVTNEAKVSDTNGAAQQISSGRVLGETDELIWKESANGDLSIQHKR